MNEPAVPSSPLERPALGSVPEPQGIGGWLLLPLLGLAVTVWLAAQNLLELNAVRGSADWLSRTAPGSATASPLWEPYLKVSLAVQGLLIVFAALLLVAFVTRSRRLPSAIMTLYGALVVAAAIEVGFLSFLPGGGFTPDSLRSAWTQLVRAMLSGAIWSLYFAMSKRVRNTFVR